MVLHWKGQRKRKLKWAEHIKDCWKALGTRRKTSKMLPEGLADFQKASAKWRLSWAALKQKQTKRQQLPALRPRKPKPPKQRQTACLHGSRFWKRFSRMLSQTAQPESGRGKSFQTIPVSFFGKIPVTSADVATALGGWFRGANLYDATAYAYPFQMQEAPALEMMFQTRNGLGALLWAFSQSAETAQQYLPQSYLIRPTTATGIHGNINIIGKGKL